MCAYSIIINRQTSRNETHWYKGYSTYNKCYVHAVFICSTYLENLVLNTLINNTQSQSLPMLNILDPLPFFPYSNIIRLAPPLYFSFLHFSHASNFLHVTNYANRLRTNTYTAYTHTVKEEHSAHDTNHFQCHSTNPVTYFGGCAIYTFHENWFSLS